MRHPGATPRVEAGEINVIDERCNQCKLCITITGCPAITLSEHSITIDPDQCYGCGLCAVACQRDAIEFARMLPPLES